MVPEGQIVFERGIQLHQLPPTSSAVTHRTLCGRQYQTGEVWDKSLEKKCTHFQSQISKKKNTIQNSSTITKQRLTKSHKFAWKQRDDGSYTPVWTDLPPATRNKKMFYMVVFMMGAYVLHGCVFNFQVHVS